MSHNSLDNEHVQTVAEIHLSVDASERSTFWKQVDELAHAWMHAGVQMQACTNVLTTCIV